LSESGAHDFGDFGGDSGDTYLADSATLDPVRDITRLLQIYGIDATVSASANLRANEARKQKFQEAWDLRKPGDVEAHFKSFPMRLNTRNSERSAKMQQLEQHVESFLLQQPPCICEQGEWVPKEKRFVKVIELTFRHECSIPRYVQCSGCDQKRPLNPIELDYFPGNPEKEVIMHHLHEVQ
jgi:hypothetical protein